jgi:hypothetical protein
VARGVRNWLLVAGGVLAFSCAATLVLLALALPPAQLRRARALWDQRRPRHYELVVRWNDSVGPQRYLRGEVRDGRVVALTDLNSGHALSTSILGTDRAFLNIDILFNTLGAQMRPAPDWRAELASYHPLLARWLQPCVARLPDVRYDPVYGYPTLIRFHSDPCVDALAFRTDTRVAIEQFRPLPEL